MMMGRMPMTETENLGIIQDILSELGATVELLTKEEKDSLDKLGYVVLPMVIDEAWLEELREHFDRLLDSDNLAGIYKPFIKGDKWLSDLVNKGKVFDRVYTYPKLLAA